MGFGDKLKGLREQAQQAVVENKDKIQGAVQSAGEVANIKTHGKYADKIAKVGEKVTTSVDKFGATDEDAGAPAGAPAAAAPAHPAPSETAAPTETAEAAATAETAATAATAATAETAEAAATAETAEAAGTAGAPASSPPEFE
ncbi:MAG TPA: antitoxin [Solirubrobacteraceae bacterium]|nr:antitoxin [Solirubrobacteraceae bacterium]